MNYSEQMMPAPPMMNEPFEEFDDSYRIFMGEKKKPKRRPIPKLDDIIKRVAELRQLNGLRDDTIRAARDVVDLATIASKMSRSKQSNSDKDDFIMRLSWPATVLQEAVNTIGRIKTYLSMEAEDNTEEAEQAAEKPIALINRLDETLEDEFAMNGGQQPLLMTAAQYAFRDGMLVQKMCRRPGEQDKDGEIWDYELIDPLEIIPDFVGNKYVACYRAVSLKVQDIRAIWGEKLLKDCTPDEEREVIAYYDDYWHACYVSGHEDDWLKKPVPHEYEWGIPIVITYFRGKAGSRGDSKSGKSGEQVEANRGTSIFGHIVDELKEKARLQTAMTDKAMLATRPPVIVKSKSPDLKINRNPNGTTWMDPEDSLEKFPQDNLDLQYVTQLMQAVNGALDDATLPMNALARFQSGWDRNSAEKQAAAFYTPYLNGLRIALRWRYRAALLLFRQFGDELEVSGQSARGKAYKWRIHPDEIPANPRVIVDFSTLNDIDKVQMGTVVTQMMAAGGIDYLTAYGPDFMNLENPHLIVQRIREQQAWQHPAAQQALIPGLTMQILERQLKDAIARGHKLEAAVLQKQIKEMFMSIMQPPAPPNPMEQMGAGAGPMPQLGPGGPNPEKIPMPSPDQIPPTAVMGGADQMDPNVMQQRITPRAMPGMGGM